jgi:hypothetical protein
MSAEQSDHAIVEAARRELNASDLTQPFFHRRHARRRPGGQ